MDMYNVCRYFMYMYTMYPYRVCILLCTMFVDYLCIFGMKSIYVYYIGFSLLGDEGESPPNSREFAHSPPHLKKVLPSRLPPPPQPNLYPPSPH